MVFEMIRVSYQSENYDSIPRETLTRYVRKSHPGKYFWCEVCPKSRLDVRQGDCDENDLPVHIADEADRRKQIGMWPYAVEWPFNNNVPAASYKQRDEYAGGR